MKYKWEITLGALLIAASAIVYYIHYLLFHDSHHILIFLVGDIAFVFIEVLMVSLVIHRVLSEREKKRLLEKLNMVIGAFYSVVGTDLLTFLSDKGVRLDEVRKDLAVSSKWTYEEFKEAKNKVGGCGFAVEVKNADLAYLKGFLSEERDFMVRLLENPILLEHESFTDLLRAVFHLTEELSARKDISNLPDTDKEHLKKDITRVYGLLTKEWLSYMMHLKNNYPYLYSLAMRKNPFDETADAVVR